MQRDITRVDKPTICCKIFEDNIGAVELANVPKMRPRTKNLNIMHHFFRHYVANGTLKVLHIPGEEQKADIFTKPLDVASYLKHLFSLLGW
jgi:hypothetical protein